MAKPIGRSVERPHTDNQTVESASIPEWYQKYQGIYKLFLEHVNRSKVPLFPTITIFAAGAAVRVCLCDRARKRSIFRTGDTPADALRAIDEALVRGDPDWRKSRYKSA